MKELDATDVVSNRLYRLEGAGQKLCIQREGVRVGWEGWKIKVIAKQQVGLELSVQVAVGALCKG